MEPRLTELKVDKWEPNSSSVWNAECRCGHNEGEHAVTIRRDRRIVSTDACHQCITVAGNSTCDHFERCVPEDAALIAMTHILGVPFHVEAIQVAIVDGKGYAAVDDCFQGELEAAYDISGDSPFRTVEIPGHDGDYVLLIYPHTL